jgi:hypothetical protein
MNLGLFPYSLKFGYNENSNVGSDGNPSKMSVLAVVREVISTVIRCFVIINNIVSVSVKQPYYCKKLVSSCGRYVVRALKTISELHSANTGMNVICI